MLQIFQQGGPIMWPLLITSIITLTVVLERLFFVAREKLRRQPAVVDEIFTLAEKGDYEKAILIGKPSADFVAATLTYALEQRARSLTNALHGAANRELTRFNRGLSVLDTVITLAPLLGLLGTVTGMIHSFGLMNADALGAPTAITGGIAQALIATAFGISIAILALIPFNFLNARLEEARREIEDAATRIELFFTTQKN